MKGLSAARKNVIYIERETRRKKSNLQILKDNFELLSLTLPALILFLLFHYMPMFGIILAFKDYRYDKGIFGSDWIGFKNFAFFFTSQDAARLIRNTVGYSLLFMVVGTIAAVVVALLIFEIMDNRVLTKIYQTTMILPRFLSWVVIGFITYALLNPVHGVLNQILQAVGKDPIQWYTEVKYWPFILTVTNLWHGVGMGSIIYYAGLMGTDKELYESAEIDGAGRLKQTWYISIPALIPLITIQNILAFGRIFSGDFGLFYQIPRDVGGLYPVTDIINTYVYRGLRGGQIGMSSAVGLFQSTAGLIMIIIVNQVVRKISPENSLF